jgi:hypothetical protein
MNARCLRFALRSRRRGQSLIELSICSLLVGVLLVASLRAVGQSVLTQNRHAQRHTACFLAHGLLNEIMQQAFREPGTTSSTIGRENGESSLSRESYDDVDDYNGYSEMPPHLKDGTEISGLSNWRRSASVSWTGPADVNQSAVTETGVKRITVSVYRGNTLLHSAVGIRTDAP